MGQLCAWLGWLLSLCQVLWCCSDLCECACEQEKEIREVLVVREELRC